MNLEQVYGYPGFFVGRFLRENDLPLTGSYNRRRLRVLKVLASRGELDPPDAALLSRPDFDRLWLSEQRWSEDFVRRLREALAVREDSPNSRLAAAFEEIASLYEIGGDEHRGNTYSRAAQVVGGWAEEITSSRQLRARGIGPAVKADTDSFLLTGTIPRLENLRSGSPQVSGVLDEFRKVFGIGPKTAARLYREGYRSLSDLGGAPLSAAQKIGLTYFDDLQERIPREEVDLFRSRMAEVLQAEWEVAGSYRRGEESSGDVDLVVKRDEEGKTTIDSLVAALSAAGIVVDSLARGPVKFMGIARVAKSYRRLDIRLFPSASWAYALLYNTGSDAFNVLCRNRAIEFGLRLNEYGLYYPNGDYVPAEREEEIFSALRIRYLPPGERTRDLTELPLC